MISAGKHNEMVSFNLGNKAVSSVYAAGPAACEVKFQRFWFTRTVKRIPEGFVEKLQDSLCFFLSVFTQYVRSSNALGLKTKFIF